jgi:hypothetical protein
MKKVGALLFAEGDERSRAAARQCGRKKDERKPTRSHV